MQFLVTKMRVWIIMSKWNRSFQNRYFITYEILELSVIKKLHLFNILSWFMENTGADQLKFLERWIYFPWLFMFKQQNLRTQFCCWWLLVCLSYFSGPCKKSVFWWIMYQDRSRHSRYRNFLCVVLLKYIFIDYR